MPPFARSHAIVSVDPDDPADYIALLPSRTFSLGPAHTKDQVEARQMASFAAAWSSLQGIPSSSIQIAKCVDETDHDFDLTLGNSTYEVELTALLSPRLRAERRRIFGVGNAFQAMVLHDHNLQSAVGNHGLLLRDEATVDMPRTRKEAATTAAAIATSLLSAQRATSVSAALRHIETVDGIAIFDLGPAHAGLIQVATSNTSTTLNSTRQAVIDAVTEKDTKSRKFVVVLAGDLSNEGLALPVEIAEYELIAHFGAPRLPALRHVAEAYLHLAGTSEVTRLV